MTASVRKLPALRGGSGWQRRAACRGVDASLFFPPERSESREERVTREGIAKRICEDCPVRDECLDWALAFAEQHGIWGGFTADERRRLARPVAG